MLFNLNFACQNLLCKAEDLYGVVLNGFLSVWHRSKAEILQVPGNNSAVKQQFNIVSERYITLDGIVKAVAQALGKEAKIVHYDPEKVGLKKGEGFPFRTGHFFASSEKAKRELGWRAKHSFTEDVSQLIQAYKDSGRESQDIDFSVDDKILSSVQ